MPSIPQDYGRMGPFYDTCAGNEKLAPLVREIGRTFDLFSWRNAKINALRESTKPIGVASYRIFSTLPEELRGQLPAPDQVSKLLEDL